jgi:hypothetical protein
MKTLKEFLNTDTTLNAPLTEAFTKQHYIAIAKVIANLRPRNGNSNEPEDIRADHVLDEVATKLADIFQQDNRLFDKGRFLSACGV